MMNIPIKNVCAGLAKYGAFICALLLFLLISGGANAADKTDTSVSCTANMADLEFDSVDFVTYPVEKTTTGTLSYTCTNTSSSTKAINICFYITNDSSPTVSSGWYRMQNNNSVLAVQLRSLSNNPIPKAINEIVGLSKKSTRTWNIPIKAALNVGLAPPAVGMHSLVFSSAQTGLSFLAGSEAAVPSTCGTSILSNAFQFKIEAYVAPACLVSLVNDLDFGVTSALDNTRYIDAQSNLALRCTKNIPYRVSLSSKNMKKNQFNMMGMRMGATTLIPYNTYKDAARTVPWDTRSPLSSVGTGDKQTYTVYGRTPAPSFKVPANQYSDINTIQITY